MTVVGGGFKKIVYALATAKRVGLKQTGKALHAKNTCKACALGMGGQKGGMTNEAGEFPSVCNKSIQAQSTDIQPAIPDEIFDYELADFAALSARELEHLGRLASPLHKRAGDTKFSKTTWDIVLRQCADRLSETQPERSFFYASGRSSNEAGFLFQLMARCYGTNHVNNCSYYCHQATGVALGNTIGTGTATIELADLDQTDLIFVIGANPASNHPRFIHKLKACRDRGGQVIVINPAKEAGLVRFAVPKSPRSLLTGGSEIASAYLQPKVGSDIALFKGLAKAVISEGAIDRAFIDNFTQGYDLVLQDINDTSWSSICEATGLSESEIHDAAKHYCKAEKAVFAWGMGMTHHLHGVQNIEAISNLALLRGMIGQRGAGLLPLRGHSNVQGIGTIGVKPVLADEVLERMQTHFGITLPQQKGYDTMAAMQAASRGEMDVAVLLGGNLFAANPNSRWAVDALNRIQTRIALTTTLNASHVNIDKDREIFVLPVSARDEEWQPTTQESMFNFVRLSDGQIIRHADVRPEVTILADIASQLLPDSPIDFQAFKQHRLVRECIAKIVPGMSELADIDVAKKEFHIANRLLHEPNFKTKTGRAHFKVTNIPADPRAGSSHQFVLSTVRSEGQFNSIIYEEADSYRATTTRWCVMMNETDAQALGVDEDDLVNMRSETGEMTNLTVYIRNLPRGNLMCYYPEANVLTNTEVDPDSLTPAFKSTPVTIAVASAH